MPLINESTQQQTPSHFVRFEKESRYYIVTLEKDLFEDWTLTIVNGRINTKLGRIRKLSFPSFLDALEKLHSIAGIRTKRNYHIELYKIYD